ncbi:MAG: hypothetical protein R6V17_07380 [Halanaerobacter sp.]
MALNSDMMFEINLDFTNPNKIAAQAEALEQSLDNVLRDITYQAVEIFETELHREIENQGLIDTGYMKGTIYKMVSEALNGYWDNIGTTAVVPYYAYYLEFGTVNHRAYKFARIAFTRAYPQIVNLFYTQAGSVIGSSQLFGSG